MREFFAYACGLGLLTCYSVVIMHLYNVYRLKIEVRSTRLILSATACACVLAVAGGCLLIA